MLINIFDDGYVALLVVNNSKSYRHFENLFPLAFGQPTHYVIMPIFRILQLKDTT